MAPFGDAVGLIARFEIRSRWRALLGLALLVAVVGTVVLAAFAGAQRTASSLDRFRDATVARDARVVAPDDEATHRIAVDLADQPWVAAVGEFVDYAVNASDGIVVSLYSGTDESFSNTVDRPLVLEGRMPAADAPDEVAIDEVTRDEFDLEPGDVLPVTTFQPDDLACLIHGDCPFQGLPGPAIDLQVVGVMRDVDAFFTTDDPTPGVTASAAFTEAYREAVGAIRSEALVRLRDPSDLPLLEDFMDARPRSGGLITPDDDYAAGASDAVDVLGTSLLVFAVVTALAGALAVLQAVTRQVDGASAATTILPALGLTRWGWARAVALPTIGAVTVGALLAPVGAALASPLFPFGFASRIEPDPGIRVDLAVLGTGALVVAVLVGGWALLVGRRRARRNPRTDRGWTPTLGWAGVTLAAGARLAFGRGQGRAALPLRSALVGVAVGVAGVLACGTFLTSLHHLVDRPERWGWTWSAAATTGDAPALAEQLDDLAAEDGVEAVATVRGGLLRAGQEEVTAYAYVPVAGEVDPTLRRGRLPEADDEIAVGEVTGEKLGVDVGDTLTVDDPAGGELDLRVVGTVALPTFNDRQPGQGSLLTEAGLSRVTIADPIDTVVLRFDDGADVAAVQDDLTSAYGVGFLDPITPPQLANLDDASLVVRALIAFFAALALVGLVQALALSGRRQRGSVAVWRALGFVPGQVRRAVLWQTTIITTVGLAVGVPVGLYAGRVVWLRAIGSVGVLDAPTLPTILAVAVVPVAVIAALAVAAVPAWLAGRGPAARSLRAE